MPICDIYLWLRTDRRNGWCLKVPLNRHICNLLKHSLTTSAVLLFSAVCNVFSAASIGAACENSLRWINRGMFWQAIWQLRPAEISGRNSPHKLSRQRLDLLSSYQPLHLGVVDHYIFISDRYKNNRLEIEPVQRNRKTESRVWHETGSQAGSQSLNIMIIK